jgi:hypothetical protein
MFVSSQPLPADDARKSIKGASESVIQTKYLELVCHHNFMHPSIHVLQFQELKRAEREHAREKQKLTKEKDACMFSPSGL